MMMMMMMMLLSCRHPRVPHHHCHGDLSGVPIRRIRRVHFYNSQWLQRRPQSISRPLSCSLFPLTPQSHIWTSSPRGYVWIQHHHHRCCLQHVENTSHHMDIKGSCWTDRRCCVETRLTENAVNTTWWSWERSWSGTDARLFDSVAGSKCGIISYCI